MEGWLTSLIVAVISAIVTLSVVFLTPIVKNRAEKWLALVVHHRQAKILSDGLRGEVKSIRNFLKPFALVVLEIRQESQESDALNRLVNELRGLSSCPTPVFDKRAGDIGILWTRLGRKVGEFYGDVKGLGHYAARLSPDDPNLSDKALLIQKEIHSLTNAANILNRNLMDFSLNRYYGVNDMNDKPRQKHLGTGYSPDPSCYYEDD